jgi:hypothetical protein
MVTVEERTQRDLERLPEQIRESAEAGAALALAAGLDDDRFSLTSRAMATKELRETMAALRALAPPDEEGDDVDDLTVRRERRRARLAAAADSSRP